MNFPVIAKNQSHIKSNYPVMLKSLSQVNCDDNNAGQWHATRSIPGYIRRFSLRKPSMIKPPLRLIETMELNGVKKHRSKPITVAIAVLKNDHPTFCYECLDINLTFEELNEKFEKCTHNHKPFCFECFDVNLSIEEQDKAYAICKHK
jgi:hypothetical protein